MLRISSLIQLLFNVIIFFEKKTIMIIILNINLFILIGG